MSRGAVHYSSSVQWEGGRVSAAVGIAAAVGVNKAAEYLRALSVALAPIDTGALRNSATVRPATPHLAVASLVFDTPYAARQHEELDYVHTAGRDGTAGGQAKYVEQPLTQNRAVLQAIIGQELRHAITQP